MLTPEQERKERQIILTSYCFVVIGAIVISLSMWQLIRWFVR